MVRAYLIAALGAVFVTALVWVAPADAGHKKITGNLAIPGSKRATATRAGRAAGDLKNAADRRPGRRRMATGPSIAINRTAMAEPAR